MLDRKTLCVDVLSEGFIDSYIELFYLSHRYNENNELLSCSQSSDELIFLKENLVMAEVSKRKKDYIKTHGAYANIGHYFSANKESESAIYFFNKCLSFAENDELKLSTYLDLALTYESLKEINFAIEYHEKYLNVCSSDKEIFKGNKNLIRSLKLQSDAMAERGEYEKAMEVLEKMCVFGQNANDIEGQQIAHKSIANISLNKLKKYQKAAKNYKKFIKICIEMDDVSGEGFGYFNLGKTYQQMGDNILATKYYESYLKISEHSKDKNEAAAALGDIYSLQNRHKEAQKYYETLDSVDAKIKLAQTKAKIQMKQYSNWLNDKNKINQLIQWKNKRKIEN